MDDLEITSEDLKHTDEQVRRFLAAPEGVHVSLTRETNTKEYLRDLERFVFRVQQALQEEDQRRQFESLRVRLSQKPPDPPLGEIEAAMERLKAKSAVERLRDEEPYQG
jgi:hypothetical protein